MAQVPAVSRSTPLRERRIPEEAGGIFAVPVAVVLAILSSLRSLWAVRITNDLNCRSERHLLR